MRLLTVCANNIPMIARVSQRQSNPGCPTASSAATSPANNVIGSTAARVMTSHRVTASTGPSGGGLVVRSAYAHELRRDRVVAFVMSAAPPHRCVPRKREVPPLHRRQRASSSQRSPLVVQWRHYRRG